MTISNKYVILALEESIAGRDTGEEVGKIVTMERVAVSLPKELVGKVEELRDSMGLNRSKFYRMALKAYVEEFLRFLE